MSGPETRPNEATREAERDEARTTAQADREPTPEEAAAAETNELDEGVAENYAEMAERGAKQKGEGRLP